MWSIDKQNKFWYCDRCDRPLDIPVPCPDCKEEA